MLVKRIFFYLMLKIRYIILFVEKGSVSVAEHYLLIVFCRNSVFGRSDENGIADFVNILLIILVFRSAKTLLGVLSFLTLVEPLRIMFFFFCIQIPVIVNQQLYALCDL